MKVLKFAALETRVQSPFLDGMVQSEVNAVLAAAAQRRFRAGSVVANQDMPADHLYVLVKGRARYFVITPGGKKILLYWLPEGEVVGVTALLPQPAVYLVSTETVRDSIFLIWDRPTIRHLSALYPRLLENALQVSSEYLTFYVATHVALTCHTASQRLAAVLLNLGRGIGRVQGEAVELDVTNEELAQAANITHFTASRLLSKWQSQGALVKQRGKILLHAPGRYFLD